MKHFLDSIKKGKYPITDILNVIAKKNCGKYVNLFIKGYANARGIEQSAKIIVNKLNCISTMKAKPQRIKT